MTFRVVRITLDCKILECRTSETLNEVWEMEREPWFDWRIWFWRETLTKKVCSQHLEKVYFWLRKYAPITWKRPYFAWISSPLWSSPCYKSILSYSKYTWRPYFNYMINEVIETRQSYMTIKWVMILKQTRILIFYFVGFMGFER